MMRINWDMVPVGNGFLCIEGKVLHVNQVMHEKSLPYHLTYSQIVYFIRLAVQLKHFGYCSFMS